MAQVTFYILGNEQGDHALFNLVCEQAAQSYTNKQRCLIYCASQQQAETLDTLLWQRPAERFVPHNLQGEGPTGGAPVELSWQAPSQGNRPMLINLQPQAPQFAQRAKHIIDFVPADEQGKQQARERYKAYRAQGHQLHTVNTGSAPQ